MRRRSSGSAAEEDADQQAPSSADAPSSSEQTGGKSAGKEVRTASPTKLIRLDANKNIAPDLERRRSPEKRPSTRSQQQGSSNWRPTVNRHATVENENSSLQPAVISVAISPKAESEYEATSKMADSQHPTRLTRLRNPWSTSLLTFVTTAIAIISLFAVAHSFTSRQLDFKGALMSYTSPGYAKLVDFDTEHSRFASKYSVYLYRESGVDEDTKVKGVPVLFIPGNAGSYRQARSTAGEAAHYFHDILRHDTSVLKAGVRSLDFFTVDFNEEFTAFHGQAILDQAEYLNEAVAYILSLYHDPRRSERDPDLPDPTSVMILGHSMGGIVARTMLVMPNYQSNSINTIITMAAPHARPPVSFDAEIVNIYKDINSYWRHAYSQKWANNNPLWHVTLISIAGGGLDTMIPSDYTSLESLVPETHGFTVFTSSIPTVWTGIDHEAILWSDQLRRVVVKALYDIVDVNRAAQTKPRAERMRVFKKWFLTGMEAVAEKTLPQKEPTTLLTLEDNNANSIVAQGERLTLRKFGLSGKPRAHLIPVPPQGTPGGKRFTLLTDQKLDRPGDSGKLEVLFCSVFPLHPGQTAALFSMNMDLSGDSSGSTRLACKNAAADVIILPASTRTSKWPFKSQDHDLETFSYLQYDLEDISDHQFVAVVDKAASPTPGWAIAEFSDNVYSRRIRHLSLRRLLAFGTKIKLPANRPVVMEVKIPALHSSLLTYRLNVGHQACDEEGQLFTPFLRQYISEPYESKFFVNIKQADINLHGIAPFMPPPLKAHHSEDGLSLQIWTDPTCNSSIEMSMKVDLFGSFGKLFMRYRTVLAAFPLLIVTLVIRKQFRIYDESGVYTSFSESMDACLRRSIPVVFFGLSLMALSMSSTTVGSEQPSTSYSSLSWRGNETEIDFTKNDLLLGSQDSFFWFLVPFIGVICVGVCVILNYIVLGIVHAASIIYGWTMTQPAWLSKNDKRRSPSPAFSQSSPRRRVLTTGILLFLVSTFIPYQFAYLVACLVQIATCIRAFRLARDSPSGLNLNFSNYAHSMLILMLWTIPAINLPILVVWVHNLAVQWLTPFSSHHNVLSIMPFILLVETLTSGKMVPRVTTRFRHVTSIMFFGIAIYAALYGVTYAYMLHHMVNFLVAWLIVIHSSTSSWSLASLNTLLSGEELEDRKGGKTP